MPRAPRRPRSVSTGGESDIKRPNERGEVTTAEKDLTAGLADPDPRKILRTLADSVLGEEVGIEARHAVGDSLKEGSEKMVRALGQKNDGAL